MGSATGLDPSTAGGGRQGGFFAGADEAGDYLGGGIPHRSLLVAPYLIRTGVATNW